MAKSMQRAEKFRVGLWQRKAPPVTAADAKAQHRGRPSPSPFARVRIGSHRSVPIPVPKGSTDDEQDEKIEHPDGWG
jgi:hypothetical protein